MGLRGRLSILSEAVSFLPFETRVKVTYDFVLAILEEAAKDRDKIQNLVRDADKRRRTELGVRFEMATRATPESVPLEKSGPDAETDHRKAPKALEQVTLPIWDRFKTTRSSKVPKGYFVTHGKVIELLKSHGIQGQDYSHKGNIETFVVSQKQVSRTPFQGHRLIQFEGSWVEKETLVTFGWFVPTDQPLQALIFHLLEPENLDSAAAWGLFENPPGLEAPLPLLRVPQK